jgi:hypothetical protein
MRLTDRLSQVLGNKALVNVQTPLRLSVNLKDKNLPLPEDVDFLVEVANTSLADDRGKKLAQLRRVHRLWARATCTAALLVECLLLALRTPGFCEPAQRLPAPRRRQ